MPFLDCTSFNHNLANLSKNSNANFGQKTPWHGMQNSPQVMTQSNKWNPNGKSVGFFRTVHEVKITLLCERPRLSLNRLSDGTDRLRIPLQDGDRSGNDPQLVPRFPRPCSRMFPTRFRRAPVSVGSREIRLIQTEDPKCGTMSGWILDTISWWLCFQSPEKIVWHFTRYF